MASVITVRVPEELKERAVERATKEGVSLNQYMLYALTDRVSRNETEEFFRRIVGNRSREEIRSEALSILDKARNRTPLPDSEIPEWDRMPEERHVEQLREQMDSFDSREEFLANFVQVWEEIKNQPVSDPENQGSE